MQKGWGCLPEYFSNQVWHKVGVGGGGGGGGSWHSTNIRVKVSC